MRLVARLRKIAGTLLALACFGLSLYALFRLVQGGSCASGGNYVSARQCPAGTGWWAAEVPLGVVGGLLFLGLAHLRFGREKQQLVTGPPIARNVMAPTFTTGGERPANWPSQMPWPPAAATVLSMSSAASDPQGGGPANSQDPLSRLERLRALRDAGALTAAEYEDLKAKILAQM